MAAIRPIDVIAKKWAEVTPQRTPSYEEGVRSPRASWQREALAAEPSYVAGVQAAIVAKSYGKGVTRAGDTKWAKGAIEKGTQRWGPGVQIAQPEYAKGFAPYRQAIANVTLPPRFARRDPRNLLRVSAIVDALSKAKVAAGG